MKRMILTNNRTGNIYNIEHIDPMSFYNQFKVDNETLWGKPARTIWKDAADEWELTRILEERVVELQAEIPAHQVDVQDTDLEGNPIGDPYTVDVPLSPAITKIEIDLPDDFTSEIIDITAEVEAALQVKKLRLKKSLAEDTIIHINGIIDPLSIADKQALLSRADIDQLMKFLSYGSIEHSKLLADSLALDAVLTQELKTSVVDFLQAKIDKFNAIYPI